MVVKKRFFSKGLPWRQAAKEEGQDQGTAGQVTQPGSYGLFPVSLLQVLSES